MAKNMKSVKTAKRRKSSPPNRNPAAQSSPRAAGKATPPSHAAGGSSSNSNGKAGKVKALLPRGRVKPQDTWDLASLFRDDPAWESAFAIERAARSQAQKNKRQGRHDPEDNDAMKKPFQKEGGHRVLENNARNTREKRDLAF